MIEFWDRQSSKLKKFEEKWYHEEVKDDVTGKMDNTFEKMLGNHLIFAGPVVDGYLQQVGNSMMLKLGRKTTGLAPPIKMFVPWEVSYQFLGNTVQTTMNLEGKNKARILLRKLELYGVRPI